MKAKIQAIFTVLALVGTIKAQSINVTPIGVGIGTATPGAALQIGNENLTNQGLKVGISNNAANSNAEVRGSVAAVGYDANSISEAGAVAWNYYNAGNNPSWSGALTRFYGAGFSGQVLGVSQSALGMVIFQNVNNGMIASNGAPIHIAPNSLSTTFATNGNVGIGTTTPDSKLDIYTGNLPASGGSIVKMARMSMIDGNFDALNFFGKRVASGGADWTTSEIYIQRRVDVTDMGFIKFSDFHVALGSGTTEVMRVVSNGNVGIGTPNPSHKLTVNGQVKSRGFITDTSAWADYVFAPDYKLPSLNEVEAHIKSKGHLPDVPSEAELVSNGLDLGKMSATQMAQIEQLMLHVIALNKQVQAQAE